MNKLSYAVLTFILNLYNVLSLSSDEITSLPGLTHSLKFRQYSGYLNASNGRNYFYWFVESQNSPIKDPLILWLNGGPGCSSLFGLLGENGPFRVNKNGKTLNENHNSWNTIANVLYLESPAGVGFSYDENNDYQNGDNRTADDNYLALKSFYQKFPQFKNNSFYISGESYAGVYIPMLALKIFKNDPSIKLKGVALGNALLDQKVNSHVEYASTHGLFSSEYIQQLTADCCQCNNKTYECNFDDSSNLNCSNQKIFKALIFKFPVNMYNIYDDCPQQSPLTQRIAQIYELENTIKYYEEYSNSDTNCLGDEYVRYLNDESVRKAIHVNERVERWKECSNKNYTYDRDIMKNNMRPEIIELISKHKIQSLIVFNGDLDFVCDFIGSQQFVDGLGLKLTQNYRKWSVNGLTAGFVKRFEGITFITVRGAGHMVPKDKPEAALKIVKELTGISRVDE